MVRNIKGGSSHKKMASKKFTRNFNPNNTPLPINNGDVKHYLGKIIGAKGDRRFSFNLFINDGLDTSREFILKLPGGERKRIYTDTIILVSQRDYQLNNYDCVYVYDDKRELSLLSGKGYLPKSFYVDDLQETIIQTKKKININDYMPSSNSSDDDNEETEFKIFNPNRYTDDSIDEEEDDLVDQDLVLNYRENKRNLTKVRNYLSDEKYSNLNYNDDDTSEINIDEI